MNRTTADILAGLSRDDRAAVAHFLDRVSATQHASALDQAAERMAHDITHLISAPQHAAASEPRKSAASETTPQCSITEDHPHWAWRPLHGPNPYHDKPHIVRARLGWLCGGGGWSAFGDSPTNAYAKWATGKPAAVRDSVIFAHL